MALPVTFATLAAGNQPASLLDQNFAAVAAMGVIQCTATGTNAYALTPITNMPAVTSYANYQKFSFVCPNTNTSAATATGQIGSGPTLNIYKDSPAGPVVLAPGDMVVGIYYELTYDLALNSGAGGFHASVIAQFVTSTQTGGFLNKLRNASINIWTRGTSALTATTSGNYTADGWIVKTTGASVTVARATNSRTGALTLYGLQITGAASVTDVIVKQRIESYFAAALAGKTVTVQAQIFNNTGGSITPQISTNYATAQDNFSSVTSDLAAVNLQACANGVWTQVAYTFTPSTNAINGYEVVFDLGNNFSTNGKTAIITETDIRETTGIAAGLTSLPPPPDLLDYATDAVISQRYLPVWHFEASANPVVDCSGQCFSTTQALVSLSIAVPCRAAPTGVVTSAASHFAIGTAGLGSQACSSFSFTSGTLSNTVLTATVASGLVAGNVGSLIALSSTDCFVYATGGEL